jgi:A/G-specific adenine glycosylase
MRSQTIAERALRWYGHHARALPWRAPDTTPWGVLVSEVMLQQTPVARVVPVWTQWLQRWPEAPALAAEPAGAAVRLWGRLGYPRRALRLHACATALVARHGGAVPRDVRELLALPGIGGYTARAVAAFAHGQREAVVDTNVRRLLARAVHGRSSAGPATTATNLADVLDLLPAAPARAARASAALMEVGALICTSRNPSCSDCPLRSVCRWRAAGHPVNGGPARAAQRYAGTDRQARGALLAAARQAEGPVSATALRASWPDREQGRRALASLVADGLLQAHAGELYAIPGLVALG